MAYRNGIYAAFDGQDQTNPAKSDFKYFSLLKSWAEIKGGEFKYTDSHEKTSAVNDWSKKETLKKRLRERLSQSKVMILVLSNETRYAREMLNYEIEQAIDLYELPLIIAYTQINTDIVSKKWDVLETRWPKALDLRIRDQKRTDIACLHVPYKKNYIMSALEHMTVHDKKYVDPRLTYDQ